MPPLAPWHLCFPVQLCGCSWSLWKWWYAQCHSTIQHLTPWCPAQHWRCQKPGAHSPSQQPQPGTSSNSISFSPQSMLLKGNLESQSFPLAEHLAEVVEENPTLANVSVQHQATLILASVAANISTAMADLTLLEQRLVPSSSLTTFYHILDLVELFRSVFNNHISPVMLWMVLKIKTCSQFSRWPATMAVLSTVILFCLILIFAVVRRLRCLLVT